MTVNRVTKITNSLSWQNLKEAFPIGNMSIMESGVRKEVFVDNLTLAVQDGELDKLVVECADQFHDGDVYEVYKALSRNLSSQRTNMNKRSFIPNKNIEEKRYEILLDYVSGKMKSHKATMSTTGNSKSFWQWTMDEINALELNDFRTIKSIYDNMMSKKSKYPELIESDSTFDARLAKISEMKSAATKLQKQGAIQIDSALAEKLAKGATKLTATEAAQITELLKALGGK